jgi:GntR family transcriptional regulator
MSVHLFRESGTTSKAHNERVTRPASKRRLPAGRGPLWSRVEADLRHRIDTGEFTDAFPGEHALAQEYGISRHTTREALRRLREEGLVSATRGRAPRVAPERVIEQPVGALYSLFASVEAAGHRQTSVVRALDVRTDADVAERLGLPPESELLHLARLRLSDDEPLALDDVWLPAEGTRALLDADFSRTALYDELAERCGVRLTGGHEQVRAVVPDPEQARLLQLPEGEAALCIDRAGEVGGRPFEWRRTLVRGDRFALTARFTPREGYRLADPG